MKKYWIGLLSVLFILSACSSAPKRELKVFNWGEYIDQEVIGEFERMYNVRVIYDTYDSNELMYTKIQGGERYDILVPTDHMVERLIVEGLVQEIDLSLIPNISNLFPSMLNQPFDPGNAYSVPYFWGNIGLIYNTETVDLEDLQAQGWDVLKDEKYQDRIYIYDSARDGFMPAFKALGYSVNTEDLDQINEAYAWLLEMDDITSPIYISEEIIDAMINEQKDIAVDFSGDAAYIILENPKMGFFVPQQGTNVWMDSMVIPSNAENVDLAHLWINFMLDNDVATKNTEYVGYTSPNIVAFETVTGPGGVFEGNEAYMPRVGFMLDEVYRYNDILKERLNDLWTRVKAQ